MIKMSFSAKAPAKLIMSGEHSVVYGAPAIAMAINQYAITTVGWLKKSNNPIINFNLLNLKYAKSHPLRTLILLKEQLQENYAAFLSGHCSIKEVIKKPFELLQYLVTNLIEKLQLQISENLEIQVDSGIPIGSGLGSSAAAIVSCLRSLAQLFKIHWEPKKFLNLAIDIENLQHGISSGIDLYTTIFGGCTYFPKNLKNNNFMPQNIILPNFDFKIVNTGQPAATTGECVFMAKKYFEGSDLIKEFSLITEAVKQALITGNKVQCIEAIKENHALLCRLGVVPEKIKIFIKAIEQTGGAAKICGAGSVYGNSAGIVMLLGDLEKIIRVMKNYKYQLQDVNVDYQGVTIV